MEFSDLAPTVLRDLKDENSAFWSVAEIEEYLNEGQSRYCEETDYLRRVTPITNKENREVYTFPDDMIKLLRAENHLGKKLRQTDSKLLQDENGDFRTTTGAPSYLYSDLDGKHQFRLYPRPAPSIEDGGNPATQYLMQQLGITFSEITSLDGILYVATPLEVRLYDESFNIVKTFPHGLTVLGGETLRVIVAAPSSSGGLSHGTIVLGHEDKLYTIAPATGVVTLFGTLAADFGTKLTLGFTNATAKNFYYDDGVGNLKAIDMTSAFSEVTIKTSITVLDHAYTGTTSNTFVICESGGIHEISGPDGGLPRTITLTNATATQGVAVVGTTIYVNNSGTLGKYTLSTGVVAATAITTLGASSKLVSDGLNLWAIPAAGAGVVKIVNDVIVQTYSASGIGSVFNNNGVEAINDFLITAVTAGLIYSDNELGAMIYADGDTFDQDEGIVIDSLDPDDTVTIEGEQGAIVSGFETAEQGKLFYSREPVSDLLEISDHQALIEFAKHRALEKSGDRQALQKSAYYFGKYNDRVRKGKGFSSRGSNNNPRGATAYYF
jgi:hypothetical protein